MFDNIGEKIKSLAMILCWIGIIGSIIGGICMFVAAGDTYLSSQSALYTTLGFVIMIAGSLGSWIGSYVLYGFGELVESAHKELTIPALESLATSMKKPEEVSPVTENAGSEKKIPVLASNKCDSFFPTSLDITSMQDKSTIVLQILKCFPKPIQAIKASIRFVNLFGDETLFENICFVCNNEDRVHWSSQPYQISIVESSVPCFSSCAITTHAYIQDGEITLVHDDLLHPINEIKSSKDASSIALEALFQSLSELKGSQEMIEHLQNEESNIAPDLLDSLMTTLRQRFEFERIYGSNHDNTIKIVRQIFDQYLSD